MFDNDGHEKKEGPANHINTHCWFKVLGTPDENVARELERRLIPSLVPYSGQFISPNWLGRHANNEDVRRCGLWNSEYTKRFDLEVDDEYYDFFVHLVNAEEKRISS